MWREKETLSAVQFYFRIGLGSIFFLMLLYLLLIERLDMQTFLTVLTALTGTNQIGQALIERARRPTPN